MFCTISLYKKKGSTHQCWAYSLTSALRNSKKQTLGQMKLAIDLGKWVCQEFDLDKEMAAIGSSSTFLELRNLLLMMVVPKKMSLKDSSQSAYMEAAVIRVSKS